MNLVSESLVVPLASIRVGQYEVRTAEEDPDLPSLAASIREHGLLCAMGVVRRNGELHLVHGHRRYSACVMARLTEVRVDVLRDDPQMAQRASLIENYHRRDVSPMERAAQIAQILGSGLMTLQEVADVFHRSVDWVRDQVAMTEWPSDLVEMVHQRRISPTAAQHLAKIDDAAYRQFLERHAAEDGCTERTAIAWVQGYRGARPAEEVLAEGAPGGTEPLPVVLPRSICMGCHQPQEGGSLGVAYVCGPCLILLAQGGRIVPAGDRAGG